MDGSEPSICTDVQKALLCKVASLRLLSSRYMEIQQQMYSGSQRSLQLKKAWFMTGHCLGETGIVIVNVPKVTLFNGTSDAEARSIIQSGFDEKYS